MAYLQPGVGAPDYSLCHYGQSRLAFRGPRRDLTGGYLAMLGGSETFGRCIDTPFPALVETDLRIPVANLGCQNAGPDVYLADRAVLEVAAGARAVVLQIPGMPNLTNRYYTVHPRRNDRFIAATPLLRALYREVDFTEIHFTRHLISVLAAKGEERFAPVAAELRALWLQRMMALMQRLPRRQVLLWLADHAPQAQGDASWLVDRAMVDALRPLAAAYVEVVVAPPQEQGAPIPVTDQAAAHGLPGAGAHRKAALALSAALKPLL